MAGMVNGVPRVLKVPPGEKEIQEKKKSRKRGHEEDDDDLEDENDGGFFKLADKTLMRMTSKEDSVNPEDVQKSSTVFKSPNAKFGPLQPLHNMVSSILLNTRR